MPYSPDAYLKLSLKLLEVFGREGERRYGFDRYWPLVGAVGTFSEQAVGTLEQEVAKGLQEALERLLRETAPRSFSLHADAIIRMYAAVQPPASAAHANVRANPTPKRRNRS